MVGNGVATNLDDGFDERMSGAETGTANTDAAALRFRSPLDRELKQAKLEQIQRANRLAALEEECRRGVYMPTDDARDAMGEIAATMLALFEGWLPELASAIAAANTLEQRDVLHSLRSEFRHLRAKTAEAAARKVDALETLIEHDPRG
jgi:hypothetical protein